MKFEEVFTPQIKAVFLAHRRALTKSQAAEIWERVQNLPDPFMEWATGQLRDLPALPANLGLHLEKTLWPQWRKLNPDKFTNRQQVGTCADCSGPHDLPGYGFYAHRADSWELEFFACKCNPMLHGHIRPSTKGAARMRGWRPVPEDYPGTLAQYEYLQKYGREFQPSGKIKAIADKIRAQRTATESPPQGFDQFASGWSKPVEDIFA